MATMLSNGVYISSSPRRENATTTAASILISTSRCGGYHSATGSRQHGHNEAQPCRSWHFWGLKSPLASSAMLDWTLGQIGWSGAPLVACLTYTMVWDSDITRLAWDRFLVFGRCIASGKWVFDCQGSAFPCILLLFTILPTDRSGSAGFRTKQHQYPSQKLTMQN